MGNWLIKNTVKQVFTMDNFFKQFRDNLDNLPEPAFQEQDWQALSQRLQPQREKHPLSIWLLWLLAPLFLMSLAANGFQYKAWENAQKHITLLENRSETANTVVIQSDTIYKIKTIFERDTVYKTKILREKEIVYLPSLNDSYSLNDTYKTSTPSTKTINPMGKILVAKNDTQEEIRGKTDDFNNKQLINNNLEKINSIPLKNIGIINPNKIPVFNYVPIVLNKKKTLRERLEPLRPKDYSVGISAGLAYPISDISSKPSGYALGVQGKVAFSPHISAWADAHYQQLYYAADRMNDGIGIPVVAPPSNDFRFNLVKVTRPMLQYMAGLRYHFDAKKWGQPYLGIGFGAVTSLPYEVDYEFKNSSLGTVWEISQKIQKQSTQGGFLLLDAGFEKQLSARYRWQLGANYRLKLSNTAQTYRLLGVKTGILFDF